MKQIDGRAGAPHLDLVSGVFGDFKGAERRADGVRREQRDRLFDPGASNKLPPVLPDPCGAMKAIG